MESTESSTLRPLTVGQILDRTMRLYRQQFLTFVGIVAVMLVPIMAVQLILTLVNVPNVLAALEQLQNPDAIVAGDPMNLFWSQMAAAGLGTNLIIAALVFVLVNGIATAALVHAVANSYLGKTVDILSSYGQLSGSWLRLLGALLVFTLLCIVAAVFIIVPCIGWIMGPGLVVFLSYVVGPLIPATVVIEGQGVFGAIRRAWDLTRRRFWWSLGFMIVLWIFAYVLLLGPSALVQLLLSGLDTLLPDADLATIYSIQTGVSQLVTMLMQLLYLPIQLTAITLMYFDLRVRTEGFDLAMMAASNKPSIEGGPSPAEIPPAPAPASGSVITSSEAGYFIAISVGAVALCVVMYGIVFAIGLAIMAPALGSMP